MGATGLWTVVCVMIFAPLLILIAAGTHHLLTRSDNPEHAGHTPLPPSAHIAARRIAAFSRLGVPDETIMQGEAAMTQLETAFALMDSAARRRYLDSLPLDARAVAAAALRSVEGDEAAGHREQPLLDAASRSQSGARAVSVLVAAPILLVGYAIAALVFAAPVYFGVALFRGDVSVLPGDRGDLVFLAVVAAAFYVPSLLSAPKRVLSPN